MNTFLAATVCALLAAPPTPLGAADFAAAPHDYPAEDAVLSQRPFVPARSEAVCTSLSAFPNPWNTYRMVTSEQGARYLLSPAVASGSFGAFRYALDANGQTWGVKEYADHASLPSSPEDLRREWGLWEHLGREVTVRDMLRDEDTESTLVVMTLLDGDLDNLALRTAPEDRAMLTRGLLKQVAGDMVELHGLGFVHHDVRPPNIFWDRSGRIILADYGIARHVDADGLLERAPWGVVMGFQLGVGVAEMAAAPEALRARHDGRADMWSLGLASVMTLLPGDMLSYMLSQELLINGEGYADWRSTLLDAHGEVAMERIADPATQSVPPRHYAFHAAFHAAAQLDPTLTRRILQHLLVPNAAQRWSAEELVQAVAHEGPRPEDLLPLLRHAADEFSRRDDAARTLDTCAQLLQPVRVCDTDHRL